MHVIGWAAVTAPDDEQWRLSAVWAREFGAVDGDGIPHSAGRVGNGRRRYRGATLSLPPRAR